MSLLALLLAVNLACPVAGPNLVHDNYGEPRPNGRFHGGIDIDAPRGTPLVAVEDGTVTGRLDHGGGGNTVLLQVGETVFFYAHLDAPTFRSNGERVKRGDVIGYVGDSGNARNTHLHFSVYPHGRPGWTINPYPLVVESCVWKPKVRRGLV